jgi:tRNA pseudouridine32 synthase / 23S rRNA pseudouridine746 synthase
MPQSSNPIQRTAASRLQLPSGPWVTVFDALCASFPAIAPELWRDRFARGRILDAHACPIGVDAAYRAGAEIRYFREVANEPVILAQEAVLHVDAEIVVADKPHGLPVMPAGKYVNETLLTRLTSRFDNPDLVPLHRIDRDTAGLVLFSANRRTRSVYAALFRERAIAKTYEALARPLPDVAFPCVRQSRLVAGEPFFRMREQEGEPNSETRIDVMARGPEFWRYALQPVSGKKHQLRVHMAALGAPILGDPLYPDLLDAARAEKLPQLQLLASALEFVDPLDGGRRRFVSSLEFGLPTVR